MSSRWTSNRSVLQKLNKLRDDQINGNITDSTSSSDDYMYETSSTQSLPVSVRCTSSSDCLLAKSLPISVEHVTNLDVDKEMNSNEDEFTQQGYVVDSLESFSSNGGSKCVSSNGTTTSDSDAINYVSYSSSYDDQYELNNSNNEERTGLLSLTEKLALIKIETNCSLTTLAAFSKILRDLGHLVPKDPRTIMKTNIQVPRKIGECDTLAGKTFVHLGLAVGLRIKLLEEDKKEQQLTLQFNIDGLPLWRSSRTEFWPILCRVINIRDTSEFMVSLHCGVGKPLSLSTYLKPLIDELQDLLANGIYHNGHQYQIKIGSFCCDAPARAFVKQIVGHTGYFACEKCEARGTRIANRTTFHELTAPLRTNESFRCASNDSHHHAISPLEEILTLDMVGDFPLDYLHLICLGVMKRLLKQIWMEQLPHRFSKSQQRLIDNLITLCSSQLPKEFNRKGRSLQDLSYWKATEFRTFLLYTGIFILKNFITEEEYKHFIYFHTATRILCDPSSSRQQIRFAGDLLTHFVTQFPILYGDFHVVYNVHSLIHLANDVLLHGPLDSFSCFGFENYLGKIKGLLRNSRLPLSQIKRRLSEIDAMKSALNRVGIVNRHGWKQHDNFTSVIPNSKNDCYIVVRNKSPFIVKVTELDNTFVTGYCMKIEKMRHGSVYEYFDTPLPASSLHIFQVRGLLMKKRWMKSELKNAVKVFFLRKNVHCETGLIIPLIQLSSS